jgi:hypothetical protein
MISAAIDLRPPIADNVLPAAVGDDTGRRDATNSCAAKASASNPPNNPPNSTKDRSRFMLRKLRPTPE